MAAKNVADLIDAIYVQERNDNTDEECKAAKEAWDALTDAQKELVEGDNADPDYFGRDTGDAAKDDPRNEDEIGENELLVVSFGTSFNDSRVKDIKGIEDALQEAYPDWSVRRAFTAQIIINHVQARDDEKIDNMQQALDRAVANGVKNLVVQPTHLMHGAEYDEMNELLDRYKDKFESIAVAEPLLGEVGDEVGITFAFARTFHPAMRFVGPIRAALGIPCVFNILGPLTNPANPAHVAIGCANRKVSPIMAAVYASRGQSGLVYTSHEGMDELAPTGPVSVWEIRDGKVTESEFDPTVDLGLAKITVEQLKGGVPDVNANAFKDFLAGKDIPSRTTALLNAASAIVADGNLVGNGTLAERFAEAYKLAEETVDSGKAEALFDKWIETAKSKA